MKFRRQHPVGRFVLDFYCAEYRLAIELDGESHLKQKEFDEIRSEHLAGYGYHVLRFHNDEVLTNLPGVLNRISNTIKTLSPSPSPRPELGEGAGG